MNSQPQLRVAYPGRGDRLRLAVIGVGALGRHHARLLSEMSDVELVAVAEPNEAIGTAVAQQCGTRWRPDYRALLAARQIDAATIVTPTLSHRRIAEDCLSRGAAVLVEKPLAANVDESRQLCELAERHGLPLQVGHIERFNPAFRELAARSGSPRYIRAERLAPYSYRSIDVSAVHDLMIHDIDLARCITQSEVVAVEAFGLCVFGGHADVIQARLRFANGCIADLVANRVSPIVRRTFQTWSETGCWTADLQEQSLSGYGAGPHLAHGVLPWELAKAPGCDVAALKSQMFERFLTGHQPEVTKENALQQELRSFVDAARTGAAPVVDGRAGLAAVEIAEQVVAAVQAHPWDGSAAGRVGPHALTPPRRSQAA